jgi:hypothetical protein
MSDRRELKPITREGVAAALQKAHRYRILNEPTAAESICLDVLVVEPENVEALVMHVLSITDQFGRGHAEDLKRAEAAVGRVTDPYKHAYYRGVICERWANGILDRAAPRAGEMAYDWIEKALGHFARAEAIRPAGNDEAILRWNTCVRLLQRDPHLRPVEAEAWEPSLE